MSKPRIVSVKKKEQPAEAPATPAPEAPTPPVRKPHVLEEADFSLLLNQVQEREKALKREKPSSGVEELREQALKDILPPEVGPGHPLELAKRKLRSALGLKGSRQSGEARTT